MRVLLSLFLATGLLTGLLSPGAAAAQDVIEKTYCTYAYGYTDPDAVKADLLANAKRLAVNELFGELIAASTSVENLVVTGDQIRTSSVGFVRIDGDVEFFNGEDFGEVCVTIRAYATEDDRAKFEPIELNKRNCVTDSNMSARQLKQFAQEEAIVQALIDYDRRLEGVDRPALLQLLQQTQYPESGFLPDTETYCVRVSGTVVPIEVIALLEVREESPGKQQRGSAEEVAAIRGDDPTFSDQFDHDDENWDLEETDSGTAEIAGGGLQIDVVQEGMTMWITLNDSAVRDFRAEADVALAAGAPNTQIGLLFRVQDADNFYSYYINGEGHYALWKLVNNEWDEIIPSTRSDLLDTSDGAVNRLGVLAQGPAITLLINDEIVDQATDNTFAGGQIALSVGTVNEANATGRFDNFDLWVQANNEEQRKADMMATDPTFTDNFSRDNGNWSLDSDDTATYEIKGRRLQITVNKENWLGWTTYSGDAPTDFLAAVDGTVPEDSPVGEYGIVFRSVDDSNFYIAALSTDGHFGVWKNVDGEWTAIRDWTKSDLIDQTPEAANQLAVQAKGPQFTVYINDIPATTVEDDTFAEGDLGLFAGSFDDFPFEAAFADFKLWDLK